MKPTSTFVMPITASEQVTKPTHRVSASNGKRSCRNVIIHGFCKFQDKGCEFNHDTDKTFVLPHPLETPRNTSVSAESIHAPVFVPKSSAQDNFSSGPIERYNPLNQRPFSQYGPNVPSYVPNYQQHILPHASDPYYFMNTNQSPHYHKYQPALPNVANLSTHHRLAQSFFIPDKLKEQLVKRKEASILSVPAKDVGLPDEVHVYHSLYPLEDAPGKILGHASWIYKAMCRKDGKHYTLIRVEGFRLVNEQAMSIVKKWRKIKHANIVAIREAFTTRAFGDSSLVFVYDYHPCSVTLYEAYFTPQAQALLHARFQAAGVSGMPVPETTLWSFITQLSSALKTMHSAGLSARSLEPNKILMTSKNRLRISCSGLVDVLQYDGVSKLDMHQQEDLLSFGKLIVNLACNSMQSTVNLPQSMDYISRMYTPDLKNVAMYLFSKPSQSKSVDGLFKLVGPRMLHEVNSSQYYADTLETNLGRQLENGRMVRLLSKLGFVNERPEYDNDPQWSETGDRYMIRLFRDYVFHQTNEMGIPIVDMAHVITCLNKLDVGAEEKILLTSRDDQTTLVVTYKELKACIASAFHEIYP